MADKHNIPKSNVHITCMPLLYNIVCTLSQRNNLRRAITCDPALKLLNEEITFHIQKHKQNIWKEHLDAHWHHRHNTHIRTWRTIHGLWNRAPPPTLNTSITFNKNITTYYELFHQAIYKHVTHKSNRSINKATQKIQGYNITLTTTQVQEAMQQRKKNNSQSPDKLNKRPLNQIVPLGLAFLMSMLETALNTNIIPYIWIVASIVPIPKRNKDIDKGTHTGLSSL